MAKEAESSKRWKKEHMRFVTCRLSKDKAELFGQLCQDRGDTKAGVIRASIEKYIEEE